MYGSKLNIAFLCLLLCVGNITEIMGGQAGPVNPAPPTPTTTTTTAEKTQPQAISSQQGIDFPHYTSGDYYVGSTIKGGIVINLMGHIPVVGQQLSAVQTVGHAALCLNHCTRAQEKAHNAYEKVFTNNAIDKTEEIDNTTKNNVLKNPLKSIKNAGNTVKNFINNTKDIGNDPEMNFIKNIVAAYVDAGVGARCIFYCNRNVISPNAIHHKGFIDNFIANFKMADGKLADGEEKKFNSVQDEKKFNKDKKAIALLAASWSLLKKGEIGPDGYLKDALFNTYLSRYLVSTFYRWKDPLKETSKNVFGKKPDTKAATDAKQPNTYTREKIFKTSLNEKLSNFFKSSDPVTKDLTDLLKKHASYQFGGMDPERIERFLVVFKGLRDYHCASLDKRINEPIQEKKPKDKKHAENIKKTMEGYKLFLLCPGSDNPTPEAIQAYNELNNGSDTEVYPEK